MSSPRVARHDAFELPAGGVSFADGSDFLILAAKHMTISAHASGTTAWFAPPTGGLRLMDCHNVTLRGLTVDYDPLTYIQADIVGAPTGATAGWRLKLIERSLDFEFLNGSLGPMSQDGLWTGEGAEKWITARGPVPTAEQVKPIGSPGDRLYETCCGYKMIPTAAVGDSLTAMLRQAHTVAIGNSSRVTMEDVTTLTTLGLNFYELDGDGGHVYRRINVTRAPGYMIGSNADGFHVLPARATLSFYTVVDCHWLSLLRD
jgi:hypothetical protein